MSEELFTPQFGFYPSKGELGPALLSFSASEDVPEIRGEKVFLWEYLKSVNGGVNPPFNWQLTGSCVNGGAQNALQVLMGIEMACLPQPEVFQIPFTLMSYGISRYKSFGDASEGDGSTGDGMAKALRDDGTVPITDPEVPKPHLCGPALVYDQSVEFRWSSVRNHPAGVKERAKAHRLDYIEVRSVDELEKELRRGRPCTFAGVWGGMMRCRLEGSPQVLMNRRATEWSHQQSVLGVWQHPTLGRIFYILNQWYMPGRDMEVQTSRDGSVVRIIKAGTAISVHGETTQGEPPGGYWISERDADYQCRTGEVRSLKSYQGFSDGVLNFGNI